MYVYVIVFVTAIKQVFDGRRWSIRQEEKEEEEKEMYRLVSGEELQQPKLGPIADGRTWHQISGDILS